MKQELILCNPDGSEAGITDWDDAHASPGKLHRAFSIYIGSPDGQKILIQKRSEKKPLWGGVWANTCCSHPQKGDTTLDAARDRLQEECGFLCPIGIHSTFIYQADSPNGKGSEHEHVTILTGSYDPESPLEPNPDEIAELKWVLIDDLLKEMEEKPDDYAPWFHQGLMQILLPALP